MIIKIRVHLCTYFYYHIYLYFYFHRYFGCLFIYLFISFFPI
nr:MAG TPA: hypothetical protein [Caudoviricetes sp.]